jgi:hypothetical protein
MTGINVASLSAAERAALLADLKAEQSAEVAARKAAREASKGFLAKFVGILASGAVGVPAEVTMKSGAQGWTLGGKDVEVPVQGGVRKARVSILVRWEDTIPATDQD